MKHGLISFRGFDNEPINHDRDLDSSGTITSWCFFHHYQTSKCQEISGNLVSHLVSSGPHFTQNQASEIIDCQRNFARSMSHFYITMTSQWARWRLKSPASRLFTQQFFSGADKRKHQSSSSLAFLWGIHRGLVNSPHKWPVTRKMFPFDDVIMN